MIIKDLVFLSAAEDRKISGDNWGKGMPSSFKKIMRAKGFNTYYYINKNADGSANAFVGRHVNGAFDNALGRFATLDDAIAKCNKLNLKECKSQQDHLDSWIL